MTQQELVLKLFIKYGFNEFTLGHVAEARGTPYKRVEGNDPLYTLNMRNAGWLIVTNINMKLNPEKIKEVLDDTTRTST